MKLRACLLALVASFVTVLVIAPIAPAAKPSAAPAAAVPVAGTAADPVTGVLATVTGVLNITGITAQNGQLAAVGTLTATVTNAAGAVIGTITQAVSVPLAVTGTCDILHLDLGPLDLNLLGLVVHLDEVVLDISAQSGPGNLLGNLLCAVTHLLDGSGGATNGIAALLNNILRNL